MVEKKTKPRIGFFDFMRKNIYPAINLLLKLLFTLPINVSERWMKFFNPSSLLNMDKAHYKQNNC